MNDLKNDIEREISDLRLRSEEFRRTNSVLSANEYEGAVKALKWVLERMESYNKDVVHKIIQRIRSIEYASRARNELEWVLKLLEIPYNPNAGSLEENRPKRKLRIPK